MLLNELLKLKYPDADFRIDIKLRDDGNGIYIKEWNLSDPMPTQEDIDQWDLELAQEYQYRQNAIANKPIYDQLAEIDNKSIRALRTNDIERLETLEQEANALRQQLLPTQ